MFDSWHFEFNDPRSLLYQAIDEDEQQALSLLGRLEKPLSLTEFAQFACKALKRDSPALLRGLLEHSVTGQAADHCHLCSRASPCEGIRGSGSLLLLAAMLDRPQQAQLLLDRGYDCNGGGLELADYLQQHGSRWNASAPPYVRNCGSAGSTLVLDQRDAPSLSISCATPLSAALLCGSTQTAEVLLHQKGIWKGESSAVCRAAVMVLEGRSRKIASDVQLRWHKSFLDSSFPQELLPQNLMHRQLETLHRIFCPELESLPDRESFLRTYYLQPASFVDFCQTSTLRHQLESGLCTEEDAREMIEILCRDVRSICGEINRSRASKLLLIKQYFPRLCRESWITGVFLQEIVHRIKNDLPYQTLMTAWKQLSGPERDLTWGKFDFWCLPVRKQKNFLKEAGEGGRLVMDMDAVPEWQVTSSPTMSAMLKTVTFRHRDGSGIGGLLQQLLLGGNLRTLQTAAARGLLAAEQPRELMEFLISRGCVRQDVRSMVLACAGTQKEKSGQPADWRDPRRWDCWCGRRELDDTDLQNKLRNLLYGNVSQDECLHTMMLLTVRPFFMVSEIAIENSMYPNLSVASLAGAACCAERGQAMELLLRHHKKALRQHVCAKWSHQFVFSGSPLTLAAALGKTEQVRLLLDSGIHPDETGRGDCSRFYMQTGGFSDDSLFVTPVLAAILFAQEETARLLLSRGATCDFSRPAHRNVLAWGSADSLALAASLPDTKFESIPKEELLALQIETGENGERTCFWNSLRA